MNRQNAGRGRRGSAWPPAMLVLVLLPLLLMPLAAVFVFALKGGPKAFWDAIRAPEAQFALRFSLLIAFATTALNAVLGTFAAVVFHQKFAGRGWRCHRPGLDCTRWVRQQKSGCDHPARKVRTASSRRKTAAPSPS